MLWSTLFNHIGKLPMRITNHQHIHAVIDDKHYNLTLKFDAKGSPYLVPMPEKPPKPYTKVYWYTAAREESEILGSGSNTIWSKQFPTESEAMDYIKAHYGNTMTRKVKTPDKRLADQWYDFIEGCWKDGNDRLPY